MASPVEPSITIEGRVCEIVRGHVISEMHSKLIELINRVSFCLSHSITMK
jgi:hypothetical protein